MMANARAFPFGQLETEVLIPYAAGSSNENEKSISMQDFFYSNATKLRGYCQKCEADVDHIFSFRSLNGYRPTGLRQLRTEEDGLILTENVRDLIKQGKIFIIDTSLLGKVDRYPRNYAPILLLEETDYSPRYNEFGYLRPISIQTKKGEDAYIVTPSDEHLWKLAKRMFEGSNSVLQSFSDHLLKCHLVMEVFAVATYKSLPLNHPIYRLLFPHIKNVISLNEKSRTGLFGENGLLLVAAGLSESQAHQTFDLVLEDWSPNEMNYETFINTNGLDYESLNVPFAFRDDGHLYWDAIFSYVEDFINNQRNLDQIMDASYDQWITELKNGFEKAPKALEFFENINNTDDVIALLTSIIWQASVGHTFQNDPSWDFAANPKIAPWQLKKSPPAQKPDSFTKEDYLSYLPSGETFQYQFNLINIMTGRNLFAEYLTEKFDHLLYVSSERQVL